MDWVKRMNEAIGYIEAHITEEIDYAEAAQIACCSVYHFQRMFPFITDVSLSEYIRRRRLTLAAYELQNSEIKVIDLALKYGYDSPEAFARAFQNMHGTTPTAARQAGTKLKAYPRISFQFSMRGAAEMNYRIEEMKEFSVVGFKEQVSTQRAYEDVPRLWKEAQEKSIFEKLWNYRVQDHPIRGILGVCADGDYGKNEHFDYIMSVVSKDTPQEPMVQRHFPAATWAVFELEGDPSGIAEMWKRLYTEWIPSHAYDLAPLPAIECYLPPDEYKNELWIPVVRKAQ
ncbi:AraC family transcriptional regulator [Paenibacillus lautus]|uniref:AraC family transcriptional regulator n=1 Tax=Paenibacillus lautus TaxID=1401 RepID=UPI000FD761C4|nr:AraC family transcriptional regulator [Paenibacillus lautus]